MKRQICLVLAILLMACVAFAQEIRHVDDQAGILSSSEIADLEAKASAIFAHTGFDVILHTTNDSLGKGAQNYTFDFYHDFRDSDKYPDGAMFAILFDTREFYEASRGRGIEMLSNRGSNELTNVVQSQLSHGDYYGGFASYLSYIESLAMPSEAPAPQDATTNQAVIAFLSLMIVGMFLAIPQML